MASENDENLFTFLWTIENCRMSSEEYFDSPYFFVKKFLNTKWILRLYPKVRDSQDVNMSCLFYRSHQSEGPEKIRISYELFLNNNPLVLPKFEKMRSRIFRKGAFVEHTLKFKNNFSPKEEGSLPQKLSVVCYMSISEADNESYSLNDSKIIEALTTDCLSPGEELAKHSKEIVSNVSIDICKIRKKMYHFPKKCFARSIIGFERESFIWSLADILSASDKKKSALIMTTANIPNILITIFSDKDDTIQVSIRAIKLDSVSFVSIFKMSVSGSEGKIQYSIERNHYFTSEDTNNWNFELQYKMTDLCEQKQSFDPNLCHLYCEVMLSEGKAVTCIDENPNFHLCTQDITSNTLPSSNLQLKMSDIYTSKLFCDVTLQLRNKTLEAHKAILCINSPVFKAMFESGMKENETNVININDVEIETFNRMLIYMYADYLEPIQFEEAVKLYEAADKYQLLSLRRKCADLLLSNLTVENVCANLHLADAHQDSKLKMFVSHYVLQHLNEILPSEEWKTFVKVNNHLANEILQELCLKLSHIQIN